MSSNRLNAKSIFVPMLTVPALGTWVCGLLFSMNAIGVSGSMQWGICVAVSALVARVNRRPDHVSGTHAGLGVGVGGGVGTYRSRGLRGQPAWPGTWTQYAGLSRQRCANAMLRRQDALLVQYQRPLVAGVRRWRCEDDGKEDEGESHASSPGGEFSSKHRSHRPVIRVSFQPSVV